MLSRCFIILLLLSKQVAAEFYLETSPEILGIGQSDSDALCFVATNTLNYIDRFPEDTFAVHAGTVFSHQVSLDKVKATLTFLCDIAKADEQSGKNRLNDPLFLHKNFDFYRWQPDRDTALEWAERSNNKVKQRLLRNIPHDALFITKYYTKLLSASSDKTPKYNQALYGLPFDEQGLTKEAADKNSTLIRHRLTRQQVLNGALEELAPPLLWLTEEALHDVLLQGTGVVDLNGKRRYFNVHRNNGIAYDYTIGKSAQARYWYFAEVPSILGYGQTLENKIPIKPYATFAGNVEALGLGKLFFTQMTVGNQQHGYLGVLADQGGAFKDNLFQLDFLVGSYYGWQDYYEANKQLPDYANTWLLLKK